MSLKEKKLNLCFLKQLNLVSPVKVPKKIRSENVRNRKSNQNILNVFILTLDLVLVNVCIFEKLNQTRRSNLNWGCNFWGPNQVFPSVARTVLLRIVDCPQAKR